MSVPTPRSDSSWKPAICNEVFEDWTLEDVADYVAGLGYRGMELAPFTLCQSVRELSKADRRRIADAVTGKGLEVVGVHWLLAKTEGFHLTSPDEAVRRRTSDYLCELARFCADVGGRILVLGSPKQRDLADGLDFAAGCELAREVLTPAVHAAEELGVVWCIEPLAPDETNFLRSADEARVLVEMLESPNVRIILDVHAMSGGSEAPADVIRKNADLLAHFHVNDDGLGGPGTGNADYGPIVKALNEIGYSGWVSVEVFDFSDGARKIAADSMEFLRRAFDRE